MGKKDQPEETKLELDLDSKVFDSGQFKSLRTKTTLSSIEDVNIEADLDSTARAFTSKIQKKIKEKEQESLKDEQAEVNRYLMLIKAFNDIRRSLIDVSKIDLGERFHFSLKADDHNGFPRLTISLVDQIIQHSDYPIFQVSAHDRKGQAMVEIQYNPHNPPEALSLIIGENLKRLPAVIKKCLRNYLDNIEELIIKASEDEVTIEDHKALDSAGINIKKNQEELENLKLDNAEEESQKKALKSQPEAEEIEHLPEIK